MTQSTEKIKTVNEIQAQIEKLKEATERKKEQLEEYRTKRAQLVINEADTAKNKAKVTSIDAEIRRLNRAVENFPAELKLLEENLIAEQARIAQEQRAKLIEQQQEVADEVQVLSRNFVSLLEKAAEVNSQLQLALSAEAGLAAKTSKQVLGNYCHGSMQSLSMLLETMQAQMQGQHTAVVGAGIVPSAVPIQL